MYPELTNPFEEVLREFVSAFMHHDEGWQLFSVLFIRMTRPKAHSVFAGLQEMLLTHIYDEAETERFLAHLIKVCMEFPTQEKIAGVAKLVQRLFIQLQADPAISLLQTLKVRNTIYVLHRTESLE